MGRWNKKTSIFDDHLFSVDLDYLKFENKYNATQTGKAQMIWMCAQYSQHSWYHLYKSTNYKIMEQSYHRKFMAFPWKRKDGERHYPCL